MSYRLRNLRSRLVRLQGGRCYYCKKRMGPPGSGQKREATLDHVEPKCAGGPLDLSNAVAACRICNHAKGDVPAHDFIAALSQFQQEESHQ